MTARDDILDFGKRIGQSIIGQETMVERLLLGLLANGHLLVEGLPGFRRNRTGHCPRPASGSLLQLPSHWRLPFSLFAGSYPAMQHGARNVEISDTIPVPTGFVT